MQLSYAVGCSKVKPVNRNLTNTGSTCSLRHLRTTKTNRRAIPVVVVVSHHSSRVCSTESARAASFPRLNGKTLACVVKKIL